MGPLVQSQLGSYVEDLCAIAGEAGERLLYYYESGYQIRPKGDLSPVTSADLAADRIIGAGLRDLTPRLPVLSEESGQVHYRQRAAWERFWLVDPLDGTREFIKGNGEFSVNIALIEEHTAILGLIYIPVSGDCYFAWRNGGAFKRPAGQPEQRIYTRPLGGHPIRVAGSRAYAARALQHFLRRLDNYEYEGIGSALKSCLIAEGRFDVYPRLGPTYEWDTAAAQCIIEEAGGQLTDLRLRPLRYNTRESLRNPPFIAFGDDRTDWGRFVPEDFLRRHEAES